MKTSATCGAPDLRASRQVSSGAEPVRPPSSFRASRARTRTAHGAALIRLAQAGAMILLAQGCALTPGGLREERASMLAAGVEFRRGPEPADLPVPVDGDDWRTLLRRALIANGDVRAAWFEWKAGVERVRGASAWPNTNIAVGYSYMFSNENVKTFDRMSFSAGVDTMENLSFPGKTMAAGRVALSDARAAGQRFRAAKFAVQRRVLDAWLDLAMAAENARLADENTALAGVGADAADAALKSGGEQAKSFTARIASARSRDAAAAERADIAAAKAKLAALTATDAPAKIATPTRLPSPRRLPDDPDVLLAAVEDGPEVKGLQADRHSRKHEEALARLQWIPDINPYAAVTGSIEQGVGAMVMLPTVVAEIQSGIAVAKAMRGAAASRLVQSRRDRGGEVRAMLVEARDAERARRLLEEQIVPAAASLSSAVMSGYSAGQSDLADLVEARTLFVDARKEAATAAVEREKALAAIEEVLGADLETFTQQETLRFAEAGTTSPNDPMQETP